MTLSNQESLRNIKGTAYRGAARCEESMDVGGTWGL